MLQLWAYDASLFLYKHVLVNKRYMFYEVWELQSHVGSSELRLAVNWARAFVCVECIAVVQWDTTQSHNPNYTLVARQSDMHVQVTWALSTGTFLNVAVLRDQSSRLAVCSIFTLYASRRHSTCVNVMLTLQLVLLTVRISNYTNCHIHQDRMTAVCKIDQCSKALFHFTAFELSWNKTR